MRIARLRWPGGLSGRLLLLTTLFVMLAELFVIAPSLASFQESWLSERVRAAEIASIAVEALPEQAVSRSTAGELLTAAGVLSVAVKTGGLRRLLLAAPRLERFPYLIDLRRPNPVGRLTDPFRTLFGWGEGRTIRVVAEPRFRDGEFVEIVVPERPLRTALRRYVLELLGVALFIGVVAGGLVYLTLTWFLVRPMRRITESMERFRADPNDPAGRLPPSGREDEIGRAEAELVRMQDDLRAALQSRARLASLGEAMAKINHDLRNMLTSAQMASDRLAASVDPGVAQTLPRLERALDRAIGLTSEVLAYGRTAEAAPDPELAPLEPLVRAAAEDAGLSPDGVALVYEAPADADVLADGDQLHRILVNLMRNAREAIAGQEGRTGAGKVTVTAETRDHTSLIRVADDGPGVSEKARERLFLPFAGSNRPGGTGLGLAIARELARGHGGDLALVESGPGGAVFEIRLPAPQ